MLMNKLPRHSYADSINRNRKALDLKERKLTVGIIDRAVKGERNATHAAAPDTLIRYLLEMEPVSSGPNCRMNKHCHDPLTELSQPSNHAYLSRTLTRRAAPGADPVSMATASALQGHPRAHQSSVRPRLLFPQTAVRVPSPSLQRRLCYIQGRPAS
ncbi:hypothetical protein SKAU_G00403160 [Synaphobranchus kaupii]|uniref:Uncharacterized protein n=1 Tax=Synaphobranchus kaupii TaxID=118154 RepID=A0A9Q1E9G4_SYNKA|nr:hypothetical protein SKAU_G00403160 [Synaphobranchus kaupii]